MLIVKRIYIEIEEWGDNKGKYRGEVDFGGKEGKIQVRVNDIQSREIIKLCAEQIVETAKGVATALVAPVLLLEGEKQ
jgi:hypothetical protein